MGVAEDVTAFALNPQQSYLFIAIKTSFFVSLLLLRGL
jgi:hypothetical protein